MATARGGNVVILFSAGRSNESTLDDAVLRPRSVSMPRRILRHLSVVWHPSRRPAAQLRRWQRDANVLIFLAKGDPSSDGLCSTSLNENDCSYG